MNWMFVFNYIILASLAVLFSLCLFVRGIVFAGLLHCESVRLPAMASASFFPNGPFRVSPFLL